MIAKIAVDMLVALQYVHSQFVAHLDIKLSNFVFKTKGLSPVSVSSQDCRRSHSFAPHLFPPQL